MNVLCDPSSDRQAFKHPIDPTGVRACTWLIECSCISRLPHLPRPTSIIGEFVPPFGIVFSNKLPIMCTGAPCRGVPYRLAVRKRSPGRDGLGSIRITSWHDADAS